MATFKRRGDSWQARVRRRGMKPQSSTFETKAAAERWARSIESKIDTGEFIPQSQDAKRTTLHEALERYLHERTLKKRTHQPEVVKIRTIQAHPIAHRYFVGLHGMDFAALRDELEERDLGPNTIRLFLAPLSNLYTVARKAWGFVGLANPLLDVEKPSTAGISRSRRIEGDELARLLDGAAAGPWWIGPVIELAIETAMRRSELAQLEWRFIDMRACTAHLPQTKNGDARTVPLSPHAADIFNEIPRRIDGLVFGVQPDALSHAFADARDRAGIIDLRLHDLRHEAVSRLFERGDLNLMEIASITGHKTLQMLKRYTHPRAADIAEKMAKKRPHEAG